MRCPFNIRRFVCLSAGLVLALWTSADTAELKIHRQDRELKLSEPRGLARGPGESLYVADFGNHRVLRISPTGELLLEWGGEGNEPGQFKQPSGLAVHSDGHVFVCDTWNHRIQVFTADGVFLRQFGPDLFAPRGIAVGEGGTTYIADTGNARVVVVDRTGKLLLSFGKRGEAAGEFKEPVGIRVRDGKIYVMDSGNSRIQIFESDGSFLRQLDVGPREAENTDAYLASGQSPSVPGKKLLWLTYPAENSVRAYTPSGELRFRFGGHGRGPQSFDQPAGIAWVAGQLFVADRWNNRVMRFDAEEIGSLPTPPPIVLKTPEPPAEAPGDDDESGPAAASEGTSADEAASAPESSTESGVPPLSAATNEDSGVVRFIAGMGFLVCLVMLSSVILLKVVEELGKDAS